MTTGNLSEALRRRFPGGPRDALRALGMDAETIEKILSQAQGKGGGKSNIAQRVLRLVPRLQMACDAALADDPPVITVAAIKQLLEFLKTKLDDDAMAELQQKLAEWVPDHMTAASGERRREGEDDDLLGHKPENALRAGLGGHLAGDPEQRAAAAMDARLTALSETDFDRKTRKLARKYPGIESITAGWAR
ncbi:MAG: hypothetical protein ACLP0B_19515 [Steroidobacteraceae bacterium]